MASDIAIPSIRNGVSFQNEHVLVTGGTGGIGRRIATEFLDAGANVSLLDRRRIAEAGERASREPLHETTESATFVQTDIRDEESVANAVVSAEEEFGPLHVVVNNAGVNHLGRVDEIDVDRWDEVLSVNVRGTFLVSRFALPSLMETDGTIVNISSIAGMKGSPSYAAYGPAKAAIINLTRQLAVDFAEEGVRVNAVAPGIIDAGMAKQELEDPEKAEYKQKMTRIDRLGQPQDVANGTLLLASDLASFITGETLVIDGGWRA